MNRYKRIVLLLAVALSMLSVGCSCHQEPAVKPTSPTTSDVLPESATPAKDQIPEQTPEAVSAPSLSPSATPKTGLDNGELPEDPIFSNLNGTPMPVATASPTQTKTPEPTVEPTDTPKPNPGGGIEMPEDPLG